MGRSYAQGAVALPTIWAAIHLKTPVGTGSHGSQRWNGRPEGNRGGPRLKYVKMGCPTELRQGVYVGPAIDPYPTPVWLQAAIWDFMDAN